MQRGPLTVLTLCLGLLLTAPAGAATRAPSLLPDMSRSEHMVNRPKWDGTDLSAAHLWPDLWPRAARRAHWFAPRARAFTLSLQLMLDGSPPVPLEWLRLLSPHHVEGFTTLGLYPFDIGWDGGKVLAPEFAARPLIAPVPLPPAWPLLAAALVMLARLRGKTHRP